MAKKRVRSTNFSESEEDILVTCILKYSKQIENKKTDGCTVKEKQCAWEEVAREFNSLCPNVARNSKALKDTYTNIKTLMRKTFSAEKASRKMTGGGKEMPQWQPRSEAMAELAKVIAFSIHGTAPSLDDDDNDDDGIELPSRQSPAVESYVVESLDEDFQDYVEELLTSETDEPTTINIVSTESKENKPTTPLNKASSTSWATYTPSQLRKPKSAQLKRPLSCQNNSLQNFKKKLIERELEMREIEHEARMKQQQAEHEARMQLLEVQKQHVEMQIKSHKI